MRKARKTAGLDQLGPTFYHASGYLQGHYGKPWTCAGRPTIRGLAASSTKSRCVKVTLPSQESLRKLLEEIA